MIVRAQQNDTLDLLIWRHLGSTAGMAAVLALNPGITSLGAFLPMGKAITLPDRAPAAPVLQQATPHCLPGRKLRMLRETRRLPT